jgi:membrane protein implicated in regulation of membrane protease activity
MLLVIALFLLLFVLSPAVGLAVVAAALVFEVAELAFWRRFLRRYRVSSGPETMVGDTAVVEEPLRPDGTVRYRGAIWRARLGEGSARPGEVVRIAAVNGLTLEVKPDTDS